jgi:hypothetical protein
MKPSIDPFKYKDLQKASLNLFPIDLNRNNREKRATPRQGLSLPIEISYLNKEERSDGLLINHCEDGMCIRSRIEYKSGMSLVVRVKCYQSNDAGIDFCNGPKSINLADVKWCKKITNNERPYFKVGLQLLAPEY